MKLLGVIVNYKTPRMTLRAAETLLQGLEGFGTARVAIVDNHSRDGSFEQLRDAVAQRGWQRQVEVMQTGYNGGFGYGNNYAIRRNLASMDRADYFYLLNSDAFPKRDAIAELVAFLDRHRDIGIAGSHIEGPDGVLHHTAFRFPSLLGEFESGMNLGLVSRWLRDWTVALPIPEGISRVDWIAGASMLIRRAVLEKIGLFDFDRHEGRDPTDGQVLVRVAAPLLSKAPRICLSARRQRRVDHGPRALAGTALPAAQAEPAPALVSARLPSLQLHPHASRPGPSQARHGALMKVACRSL